MNLNEALNPPVENKPIEPTVSPKQRVLNVLEENLRFFDNCMETACGAHKETSGQGNAADPAKAAQRCTKLDKTLGACDKAETSWDNLL